MSKQINLTFTHTYTVVAIYLDPKKKPDQGKEYEFIRSYVGDLKMIGKGKGKRADLIAVKLIQARTYRGAFDKKFHDQKGDETPLYDIVHRATGWTLYRVPYVMIGEALSVYQEYQWTVDVDAGVFIGKSLAYAHNTTTIRSIRRYTVGTEIEVEIEPLPMAAYV